jgi:hypothetical protein
MIKLHLVVQVFSKPLCAICFIMAIERCLRVMEGEIRAQNGDPIIRTENGLTLRNFLKPKKPKENNHVIQKQL